MKRPHVRGWLLAPLIVLVVMVLPWPSWLIERLYSRGAYPRLQSALTAVSNRVDWAVMDLLLALAALYVVLRLMLTLRRGREFGMTSALSELMRRIVRTSAVIALLFLGAWGMNYRRVPLEQTLRGAPDAALSALEVRALAEQAVAGSRTTRPRDYAGGLGTFESVAARLAPPFQEALVRLGVPAVRPGRPKVSVILTPFFQAAGVTGMVNPLALESIVYPELLPFERPMVMAHEWAHLAGFADEADASAVGWLACLLGDPDLAYSAHVFVVIETSSAVPRQVWGQLRAALDPGVIRDLEALNARLQLQKPAVRETAFKVYDGYLRSNRVADGVRSYSRALRVLAAMQAAELNGAR